MNYNTLHVGNAKGNGKKIAVAKPHSNWDMEYVSSSSHAPFATVKSKKIFESKKKLNFFGNKH